jgi:GNAT superfamily N-acetyltransferase
MSDAHVSHEVLISSLDAAGTALGPAIGRHFESTFRCLVGQNGVVSEPRFFRMLSGEAHPLGNLAVFPEPVELPIVRAALEPMTGLGVPSAVIFSGTNPQGPDVATYLSGRGYVNQGAIPAMAVDIVHLKSTSLPPGYELVRVGSGPESDEWVHLLAAGYGLPVGLARYFSPATFAADAARADAPLQFYAIRHAGAMVATSMCYLKDGLAGIYSVATLPSERRKGLGEHATAEPLRLAARLGYRVGILQSSEAGYGVYKKLGFLDFGGLPIFIRTPA